MDFQANSDKRRILALDLGKRRIGLALSDPLGITAQGLPTLQRTTIREDLAALARPVEEREVGLLLMGYPLHMSGREGRQAEYTREFAERLATRTGVPLRYWDERLTTVEAQRVLRSSGISIAKRARAVDQLSAQILLASYLDLENGGHGESGMNKPRVRRIALLLLLLFIAGGGHRWFRSKSPIAAFHGTTFVSFDRGTGSLAMAEDLQQSGVIRYAWQFWLARALPSAAKLPAGEYRFDRPCQRHRRFWPHQRMAMSISSNSPFRKAATCSTSRAWRKPPAS